jgi:hypothetical protein
VVGTPHVGPPDLTLAPVVPIDLRVFRLGTILLGRTMLTAACGGHISGSSTPGTTAKSAKAVALVAFSNRLVGPHLQYQEAESDLDGLAAAQVDAPKPAITSLVAVGRRAEAVRRADAAVVRMRALRPPADRAATYARYLRSVHDATRIWHDHATLVLAPSRTS